MAATLTEYILMTLWFLPILTVIGIDIGVAIYWVEPFTIVSGCVILALAVLHMTRGFLEEIIKKKTTVESMWAVVNGWLMFGALAYLSRLLGNVLLGMSYWNLMEFTFFLAFVWLIHQLNGLVDLYEASKEASSLPPPPIDTELVMGPDRPPRKKKPKVGIGERAKKMRSSMVESVKTKVNGGGEDEWDEYEYTDESEV